MSLTDWASSQRFSIASSEVLYNCNIPLRLSDACGANSIDMSRIFDDLGSSNLKIAIEIETSGQQVYIEVVQWDNTTEVAWINFKVPQLSIGDNYFTLYWDASQTDNTTYVGDIGSSAGESAQDADAVQVFRCADSNPIGTWTDSTSNSNDGTGDGGLTAVTTDLGGKGVQFDGTTAWVNANSAVAEIAGGSWTVACEIKYDSISSASAVLGINSSSGGNVMLLYHPSGSSQQQIYINSGVSVGDISDLGYHTVVVSVDVTSNDLFLYFDGQLAFDRGADVDIVVGYQVSWGQEYDNSSKSDYWPGVLADAQFFNTPKSAAWAALYHDGLLDNLVVWDMYTSLVILRSGLAQPWKYHFLAGLYEKWGAAIAIQSPLSMYWRYSRQLKSAIDATWDDAPKIQSGLAEQWRIFGAISSGLNQRWSVLQGAIQSGIIQQWEVKSTSPLSSAINQFWDSPQAGAVLANIIFYVEIGGVAIQSVTDCQAGLNINEAFNTATITISSRAEFGAVALGHPVTIVQFGVEFRYFVAGRDSGWAVSGSGDSGTQKYTEEFVIRCESETAALHRPHAADLNQEWPAGGSAEQIISDLASVENITVDFQADDFLVPPNFLKAENNTPWEVIQKITGPLRLAEQTLPDGTLIIRESFPDRPGDWGKIQPFYLLSADGGFNKYTEQFNDDQVLYNMVTVADTLESQVSDSLTIESEDISSSQKRIRVWEVPWVGEFALEHSGDDSVSITSEGVVQEELTYLAEIVDGKGRVNKPCYAVSSFSFLKNNLTGLEVKESGEVITTVSGNTLVEITYTTKYQEFVVNKGAYDKLQIYINGVMV